MVCSAVVYEAIERSDTANAARMLPKIMVDDVRGCGLCVVDAGPKSVKLWREEALVRLHCIRE
jgi:hypothetical protein